MSQIVSSVSVSILTIPLYIVICPKQVHHINKNIYTSHTSRVKSYIKLKYTLQSLQSINNSSAVCW